MLKTYSEQIKPALLAIETHKEKTSEYKKGILERIITEIKQLEDEVKLSIKDTIKDKVSSIVSYINGNYNNLATPTGLFASKGTSGRLVQNLKSNLEIFMLAISQIETLSLEASPTLKP
jgi:aspartate/tyrosine/aromatic aminotransferase